MYTQIYIYTQRYVCMCTYIYIYVHIYKYIYIYIAHLGVGLFFIHPNIPSALGARAQETQRRGKEVPENRWSRGHGWLDDGSGVVHLTGPSCIGETPCVRASRKACVNEIPRYSL